MKHEEMYDIIVAHIRCKAREKLRLSVDFEWCDEILNELRNDKYQESLLGQAAKLVTTQSVVRKANRLPIYTESRS
jgi:hypothetical protein